MTRYDQLLRVQKHDTMLNSILNTWGDARNGLIADLKAGGFDRDIEETLWCIYDNITIREQDTADILHDACLRSLV